MIDVRLEKRLVYGDGQGESVLRTRLCLHIAPRNDALPRRQGAEIATVRQRRLLCGSGKGGRQQGERQIEANVAAAGEQGHLRVAAALEQALHLPRQADDIQRQRGRATQAVQQRRCERALVPALREVVCVGGRLIVHASGEHDDVCHARLRVLQRARHRGGAAQGPQVLEIADGARMTRVSDHRDARIGVEPRQDDAQQVVADHAGRHEIRGHQALVAPVRLVVAHVADVRAVAAVVDPDVFDIFLQRPGHQAAQLGQDAGARDVDRIACVGVHLDLVEALRAQIYLHVKHVVDASRQLTLRRGRVIDAEQDSDSLAHFSTPTLKS